MSDPIIINKVLGIKPKPPVPPTDSEKLSQVITLLTGLSDVVKAFDPKQEQDFLSLINTKTDQVATLIRDIKPTPETDLRGISDILTTLVSKENIDPTEIKKIQKTLDKVILLITNLSGKNVPTIIETKVVDTTTELSGIKNVLGNILGKIVIPVFDYLRLEKIIKDNLTINVQGGGHSSEFLRDKNATLIDPATKDRQGQYWDVETLAWTNHAGADGAPRSMSYTTAIALGQITGHASFRGFGQRQSLSTAAGGDDVWEGTATTCPIPPSAGDLMSVVSTSAQDGVAGTGVQTLDVHYIDPAGNAQHTTVTMNGTTIVNTGILMRFIQSIHSQTVGTNGTAVGTISIYKTGTAGTVYNILTPGGNMSLNSARMVPLGLTFYMTNLSVTGASNKSLSVKLRSTSTFEDVLTAGLFFLYKDVTFIQNSSREKTFLVPLKFPALCIIKATAYSSQVGGDIAFSYDGWTE